MRLIFSRLPNSLVPGFCAVVAASLFSGCASPSGKPAKRTGDEIIAAGQFFHTGTKVVTWMDPGGYDAYRVERRFSPMEESSWKNSQDKVTSPNRYGLRAKGLTAEQKERFRGGGWDFPTLQSKVDQFVLHFDVCGTSQNCFKALHDEATIIVHFMLDVDGTIYQTLDLKERAWHATTANDRSVGIEIANIGCYATTDPLKDWYKTENGHTIMTIPEQNGRDSVRTPNFVGRPVRRDPVVGEAQGKRMMQYDYTPEQYKALTKLMATLCTIFPKIKCDYPRDAEGKLITHKLTEEELNNYSGVMGHYNVQTSKVDPGPAMQWDYIISSTRKMMKNQNVPADVQKKENLSTTLIRDN